MTALYQPLPPEKIEAIHRATMAVLEKTGFQVENKSAQDLFAAAGATVDRGNNRVKVTEDWVREQLAKAPGAVTLYGRTPGNDLVVEPGKVYLGTGGTALNVYDHQRGDRRPSTAQDVAQIARLIDALENIHWYTLPVFPNDVADNLKDVARFFAGLNNTGKHVMGGIYGPEGVKPVIRLAAAVAGGTDKLKERPIISAICSIISPLKLENRYVDFIFDLVAAGIPVATSCAPITGATSPMTLAGTLVQINAEALMGVILCQLIRPGAPVLYSVVPTSADVRTMGFLFGAVENGIMNAACAQLSAFYQLPMYSTGGVTESKLVDVQSGYEKAFNNLLPAMAGAQLIHNAAGQIDSSMSVAYEQYVIDDEINGMALRVVEGIDVNSETLAEEVINRVGPAGNYLSQPHTVRHLRSELFMPKAAVRCNYTSWLEQNKPTAFSRAGEIVQQILNSDHPNLIAPALETEIMQMFPGLKQVF